MDSTELTDTLDDTLKIEEINEKNWIDFMDHMTQFLTANFRKLQNGLVIDNTDEINKVYTATFASSEVMKHMISNDVENSILLTHHPIEWNVEGEGENRKPRFIEFSPQYLKYMSDHHISLYSAHVPLDRVSEFSTAVTLVQAIGGVWQPELDFFDYYGTNVGVVGEIPIKDIHDLTNKLTNEFQHPVKLYQYGPEIINDGLIGVVG